MGLLSSEADDAAHLNDAFLTRPKVRTIARLTMRTHVRALEERMPCERCLNY